MSLSFNLKVSKERAKEKCPILLLESLKVSCQL